MGQLSRRREGRAEADGALTMSPLGPPLPEAVAIVAELSHAEKLARLGAPLQVTQTLWRGHGHRADLPEEVVAELEARLLILAEDMDVDVLSAEGDWRAVTAWRATMRLLTGGGTSRRRFPAWLLGGRHTSSNRTFPDTGPFQIVREFHRTGRFTDAQLDEAERLMAAAREHRRKLTEALLPIAQRIGGRELAPGVARALREAVRYRRRRDSGRTAR